MSGIRVAVKDNFDLEGTKTSLCSRAYLQTLSEEAEVCPLYPETRGSGRFHCRQDETLPFRTMGRADGIHRIHVSMESSCRRVSVFWGK